MLCDKLSENVARITWHFNGPVQNFYSRSFIIQFHFCIKPTWNTFSHSKLFRPRGYSTKFYTGRLAPSDIQPLTLLNTIFARKGTLFIYLLLTKWYPFHKSSLERYFCLPFDCRKCAAFKIIIIIIIINSIYRALSQWSKSALHNKNNNKILNLQNYIVIL